MKKSILLFFAMLTCHVISSQNKISGLITDQDNLPLPGATILVPQLNKNTTSDVNGRYELTDLPNAKINLHFSFIGFSTQLETIVLNNADQTVDVNMKPTTIETEEIVVTGGYHSTQHENAVKIDVLKLNSSNIIPTPNFMSTLTKIPGVDMISKGSGVSKPVIRGLSMNDILVLNNGVRFENYQYSSHHPLGIDEFGIESVEVIKGPASLLYGSDAIGGVINFIKEKPAQSNSIKGDYNLQLFTNTLGIENNLGIKGATDHYFGGIRVGQKSNADFLQGGGDYAPNSRFNEYALKANTGYVGSKGSFKLYYDYNNQNLGLVEPEAIEAITARGRKNTLYYQQLNTHLLSSQNDIYLGQLKLDVNASYQNTELIHFGEPNEYEIQMDLATLTYETKLHLPSDAKSEYIVGFQGFNQNNSNLNNRPTLLLPNATTNNYSGFCLVQHTFFSNLKVQTGIRYDAKTIRSLVIGTSNDPSTYRAAIDKNYGNYSGSIGATYNVTNKLLFRLNYATAYRTPNLAELTSNGQHESRYEVGNESLVPENSHESDLSLHYHQDNFTFDLAGFYNIINHYIYISPTGEKTASDLSIYKYKQNNSTLIGGETGLHIHPQFIKWLHFETTFSTVVGKQTIGDYLPFIPANKLNVELRAETEKMTKIIHPYCSLNVHTAFSQNNAAPDETTTAGYTLVDGSVGGTIKLNHQDIIIGLGVTNLFDVKYIDHLSTLNEVNLLNPGRNISFSLKIPFEVKQ